MLCLSMDRKKIVTVHTISYHMVDYKVSVTPPIQDVTDQRQTYTYASEALTY